MSYLLLDTETTGLSPETNGLTQIGALYLNDYLDVIGEFFQEFAPAEGRMIESDALRIQKRTHRNLLDIEGEECHAVSSLIAFVRRTMKSQAESEYPFFAAFNAGFDLKHMNEALNRSGFEGLFPYRIDPEKGALDVLKDARKFFKKPIQVENHKLVTLAAFLGLDVSGAHCALDDCRLTLKVWRHMKGLPL